MKTIDACGFACPMPVIMVQMGIKASAPDELTVLVDNKCAVENVTRFAESQKYSVEWKEVDGDFELRLHK